MICYILQQLQFASGCLWLKTVAAKTWRSPPESCLWFDQQKLLWLLSLKVSGFG